MINITSKPFTYNLLIIVVKLKNNSLSKVAEMVIIMKSSVRYILILVALLALWNTIIVKPLKIFAVFLHELGHTIMAFIFGYGILDFQVNLNESGHTIVQSKGWFSSFMIANAGYLGTVLLGLLILCLRNTRVKKYIPGSVAIIFLLVTIRYSAFSFALLYAALFTVAVVLLYMLQNDSVTDWVVDIIGITSLAYAIYDTFVDVILLQINLKFRVLQGWNVTQPVTDAVQLSNLTGIPSLIWGIIWFSISIFALYMVLFKKGKSYGNYRRR